LPKQREGPLDELMISNELKTIHDPGFPVHIIDLDLIYASKIVPRSRIRKPDQRRNCVAIQQGVPTRNAGDKAGRVKLAMVPGSRANRREPNWRSVCRRYAQ
jgi:hypothetical protein